MTRPREYLVYVALLLGIGACGLAVGTLLVGMMR